MGWLVEVSEEFERWWGDLSEEEQVSVDAMLLVLEVYGSALGPPYASDIDPVRFPAVRQLRIPHEERPLRILFKCDQWRTAILLLGGTVAASGSLSEVLAPVHASMETSQ